MTTDGSLQGAPNLTIGVDGSGTLNINDNGQVTALQTTLGRNAGSSGLATITGSGAALHAANLTVGALGPGTLRVLAGGRVQNNVSFVGGANPTAIGTATVDGPGSKWISNTLFVRSAGNGRLNVSNGGVVETSQSTLADSTVGQAIVNVTGAGSKWSINDELVIGQFGNARVDILDGGELQFLTLGSVVVGSEAGSQGTINVNGANAAWTGASRLILGQRGTGNLTISGGGQATASSPILAAGRFSSASMTVGGAGSTWTVSGFLGIGGDAVLRTDGGAATLRIQPGGSVSGALQTIVFDGGLLSLEGGTLTTSIVGFNIGATPSANFSWTAGTLHANEFFGDLVNQGGVLAPGVAAGKLTVDGNYNQLAGATMQLEIGGAAAGSQHDAVSITGNAIVAGRLELSLLNGFVPSPGQTFVVGDVAGAIFGTFANVASGQRLATSDGLGSFLVSYGSGSSFDPKKIVLSAFQVNLDGDFDHNGRVDGADLLVWQRGGSPSPNSTGDLAIWKANFGASAAVAATGAVPEPSTAVAGMVAFGVLVRMRFRTRDFSE